MTTTGCARISGSSESAGRHSVLVNGSAFASRVGSAAAACAAETDGTEATAPQVEHIPTAAELSAGTEVELAAIRDMFGSRAQALINVLLAFDAYLTWYFLFEVSKPSNALTYI
eukprot:6024409-Pleurochrysis_carterae.AAC.1